jgi:heme/copper-type cytochrome/quinol oxidase subunit 2
MTKLASSHGRTYRILIAASAVLFTLAVIFLPLPVPALAAQTHTIHVDARAFAFEPGTLNVQRGDTVTIQLEAMDTVHGLYIDGYDVNLVAEPGKSATATFVADKEGKFKFRCAVACGALHPFMIGELNVTPNVPFVRALLITLGGVVGAVAFFWK